MTLGQYARWYDSIYKLPPSDRPEKDIIEDDTQLDLWYERFQREVARRSGGTVGDKSLDILGRGTGEQAIPTFEG